MPELRKTFGNTDTGDKHPEPYLKNNRDPDNSLLSKLKSLGFFFERAPICMVTTIDADSRDLVSRCMGLAGKEAAGATLFLFTNTESAKTSQIQTDSRVNVAFLIPSRGEWASVSGRASVVVDRAVVTHYYKATLKNWFGDLRDGIHDGTASDPRIGLLKITVTSASYAIVDEGHMGMDIESYEHKGDEDLPRINRQGNITLAELEQHRK
ncbi:hypothetical protein E4T44_03979 [Aureobasidium sp. EXF-8845]|nr:hypothetical protein E4T44_03979 [Aureobasidium sp. EXF-8845]